MIRRILAGIVLGAFIWEALASLIFLWITGLWPLYGWPTRAWAFVLYASQAWDVPTVRFYLVISVIFSALPFGLAGLVWASTRRKASRAPVDVYGRTDWATSRQMQKNRIRPVRRPF